MFVFTVLLSKYLEVHAELCETQKFMFWKVSRDLKSLETTAPKQTKYYLPEVK